MNDADWSRSALLAYFAEFYQEVALCKAAIVDGRLPRLFEGDLPMQPSADDLAGIVSSRLLGCLSRQQREVAAQGTLDEQENYRLVQYAMVALADEIFILELVWPGCEAWLGHLLEHSLFHSKQAGQMFFQQIEHLLHTRSRASAQRELAAVYLLALQLGFKGQYRGHSGQTALAECRKRLIDFIAANRLGEREEGAAFPQAYGYTLGQRSDHRLAPLKPWYRIGTLALLSYLLTSCAIWFGFLLPATQHLQQLIGRGG